MTNDLRDLACLYGYIWKKIGYCPSNSTLPFLVENTHRETTLSKKIQSYTKRVNTEVFKVYVVKP